MLAALQHLVEQPERAAIRVVGHDDVVAGRQLAGDRGDGGHAGRERKAARPPSMAARLPSSALRVGILRARVLVALVPAELRLHVGGGLVDRRDDGAGRGVGLLPGVDADRAESSAAGQFHACLVRKSPMGRSPAASLLSDMIAPAISARCPAMPSPSAAWPSGRQSDASRFRAAHPVPHAAGSCARGRRGDPAACVAGAARDRPIPAIDAVGTVGTLTLLAAIGYFTWRFIARAKRQLLWRVRRKLILSYIFVGLVPALLVIVFFALCGVLLFRASARTVVQTRLRSVTEQAQFLARSVAMESHRDCRPAISRDRARAQAARFCDTLSRRVAGAGSRRPDLRVRRAGSAGAVPLATRPIDGRAVVARGAASKSCRAGSDAEDSRA